MRNFGTTVIEIEDHPIYIIENYIKKHNLPITKTLLIPMSDEQTNEVRYMRVKENSKLYNMLFPDGIKPSKITFNKK